MSTFDESFAGPRKYSCTVVNGQITQGISVGNSDIYSKSLAGQLINITGLAAGDYLLEVEANPDGLFRERDTSNNITRLKVEIP